MAAFMVMKVLDDKWKVRIVLGLQRGAMEAQYFLKSGHLVPFSEQQLMDCSRNYRNYGCNGGQMDHAYEYIKDRGVEKAADYPYNAQAFPCRYDQSLVVTKCSGYMVVQNRSEMALQSAVAAHGPVSVAIDPSSDAFHLYQGGVYYDPNCSQHRSHHAMLVVGYKAGVLGDEYWIVKNSFGSRWGDGGYMKIIKFRDNHCGIATRASFPILD